jgi:antirestriction protein ArdC
VLSPTDRQDAGVTINQSIPPNPNLNLDYNLTNIVLVIRLTIQLPGRERFATAGGYYATALHELGHWPGHPDRLSRDLGHPFGSIGYARKELRAEIGSLILGSALGIGYDPGQHEGYVQSWIQILTDTPKEILYAAADAERISEYILTIEQKQEIKQVQETTKLRENIPPGERTYLVYQV